MSAHMRTLETRIARLQQAKAVLCEIIERDGLIYAPILERLNREMALAKCARDGVQAVTRDT